MTAAAGVFAAGVAFILWVLFGHPLFLLWRARRARPVRKQFRERSVSVILPVADGERWIRAKLESLLSLDYPRDLMEILVVSDGSTDATEAIVSEFADRNVKLFAIARSGKAGALNHAMQAATGDVLFFTDVRQHIAPESLRHLVACLEDPEVGVASGELFIRTGSLEEEYNVGLYWRYEKSIRKCLSAIDSVPGATGCIYAIRRELAVPLPPFTLLDDVYLPMAAFFRGYRIVLDEEAKAYDDPTSLKSEFRRKVRTQAGVYQLIGAYPSLLGPRNRMWIHFVSHKLGRLLLPFALIAVLLSSFWLPAPFAAAAVGAQALFYLAALVDPWIPTGSAVKRVTSLIRAFVVLVAAACCAVSIFFVPARTLWKRPQPVSPADAPTTRRHNGYSRLR